MCLSWYINITKLYKVFKHKILNLKSAKLSKLWAPQIIRLCSHLCSLYKSAVWCKCSGRRAGRKRVIPSFMLWHSTLKLLILSYHNCLCEKKSRNSAHWTNNEAGILTCVSYAQLQSAAVLGQPVGFGTSSGGDGGHCSGRSLPRHLNCCPQQVYLFSVHVLHVVLQEVINKSMTIVSSSLHPTQARISRYIPQFTYLITVCGPTRIQEL